MTDFSVVHSCVEDRWRMSTLRAHERYIPRYLARSIRVARLKRAERDDGAYDGRHANLARCFLLPR